VEIRRFGAGNRRPDGPPGTVGVRAAVIHADARGTLAELAFMARARLESHSNPNTSWFVVIEGGGWVQVGDERARVGPGEAVLWPAGEIHAAWTELTEMRAFIVEFAGPDERLLPALLEGQAVVVAGARPVARLDAEFLGSGRGPAPDSASEGEPE
jgi:quercetin dioxygenase-like cupin family protein